MRVSKSLAAKLAQDLKLVRWEFEEKGLKSYRDKLFDIEKNLLRDYGVKTCVNCHRYQDNEQCYHCGCDCEYRV